MNHNSQDKGLPVLAVLVAKEDLSNDGTGNKA